MANLQRREHAGLIMHRALLIDVFRNRSVGEGLKFGGSRFGSGFASRKYVNTNPENS